MGVEKAPTPAHVLVTESVQPYPGGYAPGPSAYPGGYPETHHVPAYMYYETNDDPRLTIEDMSREAQNCGSAKKWVCYALVVGALIFVGVSVCCWLSNSIADEARDTADRPGVEDPSVGPYYQNRVGPSATHQRGRPPVVHHLGQPLRPHHRGQPPMVRHRGQPAKVHQRRQPARAHRREPTRPRPKRPIDRVKREVMSYGPAKSGNPVETTGNVNGMKPMP